MTAQLQEHMKEKELAVWHCATIKIKACLRCGEGRTLSIVVGRLRLPADTQNHTGSSFCCAW